MLLFVCAKFKHVKMPEIHDMAFIVWLLLLSYGVKGGVCLLFAVTLDPGETNSCSGSHVWCNSNEARRAQQIYREILSTGTWLHIIFCNWFYNRVGVQVVVNTHGHSKNIWPLWPSSRTCRADIGIVSWTTLALLQSLFGTWSVEFVNTSTVMSNVQVFVMTWVWTPHSAPGSRTFWQTDPRCWGLEITPSAHASLTLVPPWAASRVLWSTPSTPMTAKPCVESPPTSLLSLRTIWWR